MMEAPERKTIAAQTVISLRRSGSHNEIGSVYRQLHRWARAKGVEVRGNGLTVFLTPPHEFDPGSALFEVCLPVAAGAQGDEEVAVKDLPACDVAAAQVKGPYDQVPAHYAEMLAWLAAEGLEAAGPPREVYVKRPNEDGGGDPEEFVTEIQFPIAQ